MGMDLVAGRKLLHMNWSSWSVFGNILDELRQDTSEITGSNDGELICKETCKAWAVALEESFRPLNHTMVGDIYPEDICLPVDIPAHYTGWDDKEEITKWYKNEVIPFFKHAGRYHGCWQY